MRHMHIGFDNLSRITLTAQLLHAPRMAAKSSAAQGRVTFPPFHLSTFGGARELAAIASVIGLILRGKSRPCPTIGKGRVYRPLSQAGPGNDINTGSPGSQKAPA
jgi:hypothetical protein